jgi:plasmid stabilization system protein ParE
MKTYNVIFSPEAEDDVLCIYDYIAYELAQPYAAGRYFRGLIYATDKLRITGASYAASQRKSLRIRYGADVRTVTYKKMTIVYNIVDDTVYIRRVMPGSMVL